MMNDQPDGNTAGANTAGVQLGEVPPAQTAEVPETTPVAPTSASEAPVAAVTPVAPAASATTTQPPKKFTALNVNKIFLEKASPTISPATTTASSAATPKPAPPSSLAQTRLSATPAQVSRLTSAKLSTAGKPQLAGWASPTLAAAAKPASASPAAQDGSNPSTSPPRAAGGSVTLGGAGPRLATTLGSAARSASPHSHDAPKGSPSMRAATLGALNRSGSPAGGASGAAPASSASPWAKLKASGPTTGLGRHHNGVNTDFPTAAEAAAFKRAQEEREKQEAAEAALRHEQYLKTLDRFRGTAIGSGRHWDELDDEDGGFLDEVVEFGDGTQYKVPVQAHQKESDLAAREDAGGQAPSNGPPISKEERFRDVDHDRSWPAKAAGSGQQGAATANPPPPQQPHRRPVIKETLDISSGTASISLDDAVSRTLYDPSRGSRPNGVRRYEDSLMPSLSHRRDSRGASDQPAVSQTAARAWGPLAQRQASLNPGAPKPAVPVPSQSGRPPQVSGEPRTEVEVVETPAPSSTTQASQSSGPERNQSRVERPSAPVEMPKGSSTSSTSTGDRALPPHLAMQHRRESETAVRPTHSSLQQTAKEPSIVATKVAPAVPVAPWLRTEKPETRSQPPVQAQQPEGEQPAPPAAPETTGPSEREEMLSAAERARRRREEEELLRAAEKERARQKAAAIEERMRKEAEEKAAAERQAKEQKEQARRKEQEEAKAVAERNRLQAEELKRKEAEARANVWRPKSLQNEVSAASVPAPSSRHAPEKTAQRPGAVTNPPPPTRQPMVESQQPLSPSDEAASWRRQGPLPKPVASKASRKASVVPPVANEGQLTSPPQLLRRAAEVNDPKSRTYQESRATREGSSASTLRQQTAQPPQHDTAGPDTSVPVTKGNRGNASSVAEKRQKPESASQQPASPVQQQQQQNQTGGKSAPAKTPTDARSTLAAQDVPIIKRRVAPEPPMTREPLAEEQRPVWNRFKVQIRPAAAAPPAPKALFKQQKRRIAASHQYESLGVPKAHNVLTWDPPIPNLSARTLNRDDEFFRKRFHKGKVIAAVSLPARRLPAGPSAELRIRPDRLKRHESLAAQRYRPDQTVAVKLPAQLKSASNTYAQNDPSASMEAAASIPSAPAAMRTTGPLSPSRMRDTDRDHFSLPADPRLGSRFADTRASFKTEPANFYSDSNARGFAAPQSLANAALELASRPELDFGRSPDTDASRRTAAAGAGTGLAFSQRAAVGSGRAVSATWRSNAHSPVFMVNSELENHAQQAAPAVQHALDLSSQARNQRAVGGSSALSGEPISPSPVKAAAGGLSASSSRTPSAVPTPLMPSTGLGTSTWGHASYSFLDANGATASHRGPAQQHYQDVWGHAQHGPSRSAIVAAAEPAELQIGLEGRPSGAAALASDPLSLRDMVGDNVAHESFLPSSLLNDDVIDAPMTSGETDPNGGRGGSAVATNGGSHAGGSRSAPNASPNLLRSPQTHLGTAAIGEQGSAYGRSNQMHHMAHQHRQNQFSAGSPTSTYYGRTQGAYDRGQQHPSQYIDAAMGGRGYGRPGSLLGTSVTSGTAAAGGYGGYGPSLTGQMPRRHNAFAMNIQPQSRSSASLGPGTVGPVDGSYGNADVFSQAPASHGDALGAAGKIGPAGPLSGTWSEEHDRASSFGNLTAPAPTSSHSSPNASRMPFARGAATSQASSGASPASPSAGYNRGGPYNQYTSQQQYGGGKGSGYSSMRHALPTPSGTKLNADASAFQQRAGPAASQHRHQYGTQRVSTALGGGSGGDKLTQDANARVGSGSDGGSQLPDSGTKTPRQQSQETAAALWS
ncbi:unnamed protein product [Parajaminaea phylloscopi]